MRAVDLAKVAAEAELLRIQYFLKRQGVRAAFGLIAAVFVLSVLVLVDILIWQCLCLFVQPIFATLILFGVNLLIAAIFLVLALRSSPSRGEREALEVRKRALQEARNAIALTAVIPLAATLLRSRRSSARKAPFWRRLR